MALPAGFTVDDGDEDEKKKSSGLPAGFTLDAQPSQPKPEQDRPFIEEAAEFARGINRGTLGTFEFGQDIMDIPIQAAKAGLLAKDEHPLAAAGKAAWGQINPFAEDSEIDVQRQQAYDDLIPKSLTEEKFDSPWAKGAQWTQEMLAGGGKAVLKPILGALGAGTGAGVGSEIGGETGEMVMGLLGGFTSPTIARAFTPKPGGTDTAFEVFKSAARDPELAIANIKKNLAAGKKGSIADLAEDPGIYNLEQTVPKGTPEYETIFGQIQEGQTQQLDDFLKTFGGGDANVAQSSAQDVVDSATQQIDETEQIQRNVLSADETADAAKIDSVLTETRKKLDQQAGAVDTAVPPSSPQASEDIGTAYNALDEKLRLEVVNPAWKQFDELSSTADGSQPWNVKEEFLAGLNETDRKIVTDDHNDVFKLVDNWIDEVADEAGEISVVGKDIAPSEIQSIISRIGDKFETMKSSQGGVDNSMRQLKSLQKKLESYLDNSVTPETREAYKAAKEASRDYYAKVKPDIVRKGRIKTPEEMGKSVFITGDKGRAAARELKQSGDPEIIAAAQEYVRAQGDKVTPAFMQRYKPFLDEFPELKAEMQAIADSKSSLKETMKNLDNVEREAATQRTGLANTVERNRKEITREAEGLRKSVAQSTVKKYADNPGKTIDTILNNRENAARDLADLAGSVDEAGFMRNVGDVIGRRLNTDLLGGGKGLDANSMNRWEDLRGQLGEYLSPEQMKSANTAIDRAYSDVYRKMSSRQRETVTANMGSELAINFMSATMAGMLPGTHTLMYGGRIRQFLSAIIGQKDKNEKAVSSLLADPNRLVALADQVQAAGDVSRMPVLIRTALIEGGEEENAPQ